jgi:hypothetical protein
MAFRLPSLQREFVLACSFDPALDMPEVPKIDRSKASEDEIKLVEKLEKERAEKFKVACDHGRWDEITKKGESLTLFTCRGIHGPGVNWLRGEASRHERQMDEIYELAFRLGVKGVENLGSLKISAESFEFVDGQQLLTRATLERFTDVGRDMDNPELGPMIVKEIGALLFLRAIQGVPPLS